MAISKEEVKHVAYLSRLEFGEKDIEDFTRKFASVLDYVEKLKEIDTEGVEATYHVNSTKNVMRDDMVGESMDRDKVLENAPDKENGYFKLPNMIE